MTTKEAVDHLCAQLKVDESYYYSWKANIAMAFQDAYYRRKSSGKGLDSADDIHSLSNQAADDFLHLLFGRSQYPMNGDSLQAMLDEHDEE